MSEITITHETPNGTVAFEARLYYDDGDNPNADIKTVGYFTDESEAVSAMHLALADMPVDRPSMIVDGNTAAWCGVVDRGKLNKQDDDEWFVQPMFESDDHHDSIVTYRHQL